MGKTYRSKIHTHHSSKWDRPGRINVRICKTDEDGNFEKYERGDCSDRNHALIKSNKRLQRHLRQQETQELIDEELDNSDF